MNIDEGHKCLCVSSMKLVCLNLWLGEVCTDYDANDDANTDANDAGLTKHDCHKCAKKHDCRDWQMSHVLLNFSKSGAQ